MTPTQLEQYTSMALGVTAVIASAVTQLQQVSVKVAEAQRTGREITDVEWQSIMQPSNQAIIDLEAAINHMRTQQVALMQISK